MHNTNNKNILQEFCQKKQWSIPKYDHTQIEGLWQSTVTLYDQTSFIGEPCKNKTDSDKASAYLAMQKLGIIPECSSSSVSIKKFDHKTAILIDIENMPKFFNNIPPDDLDNPNLVVYGFINKSNVIFDKLNHPKLIKIVSPSTRQDSSDCCMQLYIGMFLSQNLYDCYYIVTRDHFANVLEDLLSSSSLSWSPKTVKQILRYQDI